MKERETMNRFIGKSAIVTGGARGIGAAISRKFAHEGASVAVLDVDYDGASMLAQEIKDEGGKAIALKVNIANAEEVETAFNKVVEEFGKLDILVNNAGVIRDNMLFKMEESDWDTVMDVHLKGSFLCSREAQKHMVAQKYGKIVNLSSTSALGNRGQANYSAAKAGLQGLTRTMSLELGPFGINVNAIAPGFIKTEMTKATAERMGITLEQMIQGSLSQLAIKRAGEPEDIANAAAFLCSEEASYVTGQTLYVAGRPTI